MASTHVTAACKGSQMSPMSFFMQSQCSINSNITIVTSDTSVGVVAVIDVVRSQVL